MAAVPERMTAASQSDGLRANLGCGLRAGTARPPSHHCGSRQASMPSRTHISATRP